MKGNVVIVLVIGPSGVGKTTYCAFAEKKVSNCRFFDLDSLVGQRQGISASKLLPEVKNERFLELCIEAIDALVQEHPGQVSLVAVGAGALQSSRALDWIRQHSELAIVVIAPSDEVYARGGKRNENRSLSQFIETEYSQYRQEIYNAAKYRCDVKGLSTDDSQNSFSDLIGEIISQLRPQIQKPV